VISGRRLLELKFRGRRQEIEMTRVVRAFLSYVCRHSFRDSRSHPGMQICRRCGRTRLFAVCG